MFKLHLKFLRRDSQKQNMWEPTSETNYFFVEKNVTTQKLRVLLPIRFEKKYISYIDNVRVGE